MQSAEDSRSANFGWHYLAIVLILLVGAGLRLIPLGHEALSGDELFSRRIVMQPVPDAFEAVRQDLVHPPLYYFLLKAGTSIWGADALGLRLISLLCGIATIGLIAVVGTRLPGAQWCGLLAAAGVAAGRYQVFYSQEARSYAFYTMLVVLLALWVDAISKQERNWGLWLAGCGLMTVLVYTHYDGALYIVAAVLALLLSRLSGRARLLALAVGAVAALLFLPWLAAISEVAKKKHGVGENLDWMGHPGLYDLKLVWANALGVWDFTGATALALAAIFLLTAAALVLVHKKQGLQQSPVILALALMAALPPAVVFMLSNRPFQLPLFGFRHLLPTTVALLLLCCYGLERISQCFKKAALPIAVIGSSLLLILVAAPTVKALRAGPTRYPYDAVEARVEQAGRTGLRAYTAWYYGEGEPVNYYCKYQCVLPLPENESALPPRLLLLYRPQSRTEADQYRQLLQSGYVDEGHALFTDGLGTAYGTMTASLERRK